MVLIVLLLDFYLRFGRGWGIYVDKMWRVEFWWMSFKGSGD